MKEEKRILAVLQMLDTKIVRMASENGDVEEMPICNSVKRHKTCIIIPPNKKRKSKEVHNY